MPPGVRNRAWFYLAKIWYARGYYDKADAALRQIKAAVGAARGAARRICSANVLHAPGPLRRGHRAAHATGSGPPDWMAYARFNLGVALVRSSACAEADPILTAWARCIAQTPELLALRDRANLALGFAYLQANQPARRACRWSACA